MRETVLRKAFRFAIFCILFLRSPLFAQVGTATISGFVYDTANGEALIGANVFIAGSQIGSSSNIDGYYVMPRVPVGQYTLVAHFIGYAQFKQKINLTIGDNLTIDIHLKEKSIELQRVVVIGESIPEAEKLFEKEISKITLSARQINSMPQVAEADLLRSLQTLPGILPISDFSSALYVRGGTPDQNLNLIDGSDVYNPEHAFGLFSTFNTDAIKQVELSKGGFSAKYGGRLSSILDVTNLDGNREEFEGTAAISLLSAKTTLQMPLPGRGSISGSFRRTYFDKTIAKAIDEIPNYYFYDGNIKATIDINPRNKITVSGYMSEDVLDLTFNKKSSDDAGFIYNWGNRTGSVRWTTVLSPQLFANFWVTTSRFDSDFSFGEEIDLTEKNFVSDLTFKGNFEYHFSERFMTGFGFEQKNLHLIFNQKFPGGEIDIDVKPKHYAGYVHNSWRPNYRWNIEFGLRYNYFDAAEDFKDFAPRFSAKYRLTDSVNLKAAGGGFFQYLHRIPRAFVADIWMASDQYQHGSSAKHYIVGISKDFFDDYQVEIEGYFKDFENLHTFNQNVGVDITPDDFVNGEPLYTKTLGVFNQGEGDSRGIEILFRKELGAVTGWAGYTFSITDYLVDGVNQNEEFNPRHDRTHAFSLVANIDWKNFRRAMRGELPMEHKSNWRLGLTFVYTSGQPITVPGSGYYINPLPDINERERLDYEQFPAVINDFRLPPYMRLDVSITYEKHFKSWSIFPYLQIFNIGNRGNVWFLDYDSNNFQQEVDTINMFPILPTIGVNFKF